MNRPGTGDAVTIKTAPVLPVFYVTAATGVPPLKQFPPRPRPTLPNPSVGIR